MKKVLFGKGVSEERRISRKGGASRHFLSLCLYLPSNLFSSLFTIRFVLFLNFFGKSVEKVAFAADFNSNKRAARRSPKTIRAESLRRT